MEFKDTYITEPYVQKYLPPYLCSCIAQFRAGILPIEIELGCYRRKKQKDRLCVLCSSGDVEDENHFLFVCQRHSNLRNIPFKDISRNNNFNQVCFGQKVKILMKEHVKSLAIYIYNALQKRRDTVLDINFIYLNLFNYLFSYSILQ